MGGLGNQMFQYVLGRHLAIKNKAKLRLDVRELKQDRLRNYELDVFNIPSNILSNSAAVLGGIFSILRRLGLPNIFIKYTKENNHYFDKSVLEKKGNIYLEGWWQCEEYFKDIKDVIKKDFRIKIEPDKQNKLMLKKIRDTNSICLHIRRGDYVENPKTRQYHGTCSLDYYNNSIKMISRKVNNPVFFVFSDDFQWARKNLKIDQPTIFVDINGPEKGYADLALMSNCKHFIIANSSFSWWGAWLSSNPDKIICAPHKWFNQVDEGDIVPKNWIRIKN